PGRQARQDDRIGEAARSADLLKSALPAARPFFPSRHIFVLLRVLRVFVVTFFVVSAFSASWRPWRFVPSGVPDTRVEHGVEGVGGQVDPDEDQREDEDRRL